MSPESECNEIIEDTEGMFYERNGKANGNE